MSSKMEKYNNSDFDRTVALDIANERNCEAKLYLNFSSKNERDLAIKVLDSIAGEYAQMGTGDGYMEYYVRSGQDPESTKNETGIEVIFSRNPDGLEKHILEILKSREFNISQEVYKTLDGQPAQIEI